MTPEETFNLWLENIKDPELLNELNKLKGNQTEILDRFYKNLEFGTAGLRGILGAGTNRINIYTVRRATQGLADYLNTNFKNPSCAISFDSRNKSSLFAHETARVLAANNIKVYITKELAPTPFLSFVVREFKASAGVMITASHNPAEWNGYKCYGPDGAQISGKIADEISNFISKIDIFYNNILNNLKNKINNNLIEYIDEKVYGAYLNSVLEQRITDESAKKLKVVYTALNGAGSFFVKEILKCIGVKNLEFVKEQDEPDESFTTCPYPNPENFSTFVLSLKLAKENNADIIIATDPDADRIGVCIKNGQKYEFLTGNQLGVLLLNFILKNKKNLPDMPICFKSIVSTSMVDEIAKNSKCIVKNVLIGFKYIGQEILKLEQRNLDEKFIFGFEESGGYLTGTYCRDKDGVLASMLVCEMAAFYKNHGKNLIEILNNLYKKHGFFKEKTIAIEIKGENGAKKINSFVENLRKNPPKIFGSVEIDYILDYKNQNDLPKSNILELVLKNCGKIIIRPSGTEPKLKFYILLHGKNEEILYNLIESIEKEIENYGDFSD